MEMIHRGLGVACLILLMAGLGACATVPVLTPPEEAVLLPFLSLQEGSEGSWKIGHVDRDWESEITEFVRPDETVNDWSELVTLVSFEKAKTAEAVMSAFEKDLTARCPGSKLAIHERLEDGVLFEASVAGCESGPPEDLVGRILDGASSQYVVQYAVREPLEMST